MTVSPLVWSVTVVFILALLAFDYFFHIGNNLVAAEPDVVLTYDLIPAPMRCCARQLSRSLP
ncbi:hypothetical protein ACFRJ8_08630 [Arthrobacter sp. NPDC056886]|uniref:hypothetical protein n=1 Tax=Arthrobacter sp. NPDC056886 TaxID=3345960 RepID=UPI00366C8EDA